VADVDISGLPKGEVLAALYNAMPQMGMGIMGGQVFGSGPISVEHAARLYRERGPRIGSIGLRTLGVDLGGDRFDGERYDLMARRPGAAEAAVAPLRRS